MSKKWICRLSIWIGLTVSGFIPLQTQALPSHEQISGRIQQLLSNVENNSQLPIRLGAILSDKLLNDFYQQRQFHPAWVSTAGMQPLVQEMIHAIRQSRFEGLGPEFYHLNEIISITSAIANNISQDPYTSIAYLDLLLTHGFLQLGRHLQHGKLKSPMAISDLFLEKADTQLLSALNDILISGKIFSELDKLKASNLDDQRLRLALSRYMRIKAKGGWPNIPPGQILKRGDRDGRINLIEERLFLTGDLIKNPIDLDAKEEIPPVFDANLESAIGHFQSRHGLRKNGHLDQETLLALNIPIEQRLVQIQINMDQRRWLPRNPGQRHIIVNIPSMELNAVQNEETVLKMRVIVGKPEHQTPVLSDTIPYLVFNPYWYIPPDFIEHEILPAMKENTDYLAIHGIRLFEKMSADEKEILPETINWHSLTPDMINFYFRQDPGWNNSLGAIKFVMPNKQHIYLHDTPSKGLFQRSSRALSSGCVRVERPAELAAFVLQETRNWTKSEIHSLMDSGNIRKVDLVKPVPLHITYWTVLVDQKNQLRFLPDVYQLEPDLTASFMTQK